MEITALSPAHVYIGNTLFTIRNTSVNDPVKISIPLDDFSNAGKEIRNLVLSSAMNEDTSIHCNDFIQCISASKLEIIKKTSESS